ESGVKMIMVRADGKGDFVPYEKEVFFTTNGDHYIEAKAIDAVGNVSDTVILSVYVDVIPPKTSVETVAE
ncbi:MAG: OmpL47-type beta-barrel domain-containing protein, partial [Spirochaetota bacterium]